MPDLIDIDFHRNGIGGTPFFAVLFEDNNEKFLATYFPNTNKDGEYEFFGHGNLSIISISRINKFGVGRENHWRSAYHHEWVDNQVKKYRDKYK